MRVLIVFWHGIGDCVLATPALREYARSHPDDSLSIAATKPVLDSGFFDACPYIDEQFLIPNPWSVDRTYRRGKRVVKRIVRSIAERAGFAKIIVVSQHWSLGVHKLTRTRRGLSLSPLRDTSYDVFLWKSDIAEAKRWLKEKGIKRFVFVHRKTDIPKKDLPKKVCDAFLKRHFPGLPVVEPGVSFPLCHINFSLALLKLAEGVVVVDSVFLHAADAFMKSIDLAYFNLRPGVADEVRPLHVEANVVKGPFERELFGSLVWFVKRCIIYALHPGDLFRKVVS